MNNRGTSSRLNNYHTPKRQLLGHAGPAPAWRNGPTPGASGSGARPDSGSKILVTNLPSDVSPSELKDLFEKTIGPTREHYLIHNNQGRSKGQAVVYFSRGTDASLARQKYNGKLIDGRLKLKVEIVIDSDAPGNVAAAAPPPTSLLARMAPSPAPPTGPAAMKGKAIPAKQQQPAPAAKKPVQPVQITGGARKRTKKGAKRVAKQKRPPVDHAALDQEMDEYRAGAP
ncbi:hypothetical protein PENSPDRAFT_598488 [Peniophora sp. CONT]|nr:hypothetical protein PENSPDRAFT_598488 [Peniophora sp. CONT]